MSSNSQKPVANDLLLLFRTSKDRKLIEVNRRPVIDLDKEQEIDKRRKDIAKQKEAREKKMKLEVCGKKPLKNWDKLKSFV